MRWVIVAFMALSEIAFEVIEHWPMHVEDLDFLFWFELLVSGLIFPLLVGLWLEALVRKRKLRIFEIRSLHRLQDLSLRLASAENWEDLLRVSIDYIRTFLPVNGALLLAYNPDTAQYENVALWNPGGEALELPSPLPAFEGCSVNMASRMQEPGITIPCICLDRSAIHTKRRNIYCQPLEYQGSVSAVLYLYFPDSIIASAEGLNILKNASPEITQTVERIRLQRSLNKHADLSEAVWRRIARDMHETLGQNLVFLRLKLDQLLVIGQADSEVAGIRDELERLLDVADEACEQMRGTLKQLLPDSVISLYGYLLDYSRIVGDRFGLKIEIANQGQPYPLPTHVKRNIISILKEALTNTVKHANASRVSIHLIWSSQGLEIQILDDGQGFEPDEIPQDKHFGLRIMRECVEEIYGDFTLTSSQAAGTEIKLWFPVPRSG
jgi:signal transduction histidine kinase